MDKEEAFLKNFMKHQDQVRAFIRAVVWDLHVAEDIFQEVAIILWKKYDSYDVDRPFGAWARGIAAKKILQSRKQNERLPILLPLEAIEAVSAAFDRREDEVGPWQAALQQCVELLPEKLRHLLALKYERLLPIERIAMELHSTLDAVSKSLYRLRARLQECVQERLAARGPLS